MSRRPARLVSQTRRRTAIFVLAALALGGCPDSAPDEAALPRLAFAPGSLTVSGISAGGYMAGQLHIAHSSAVAGAAMLAAGPYYCAEGAMTLALGRCLSGDPAIPVDRLVAVTGEMAAAGSVDPISGLQGDRVWIFRGAADAVVHAPVVDALEVYYRSLPVPTEVARAALPAAAHTFPTLAAGAACDTTAEPFVGACNYDAAGALLAHLYGALEPRGDAARGELIAFDQRTYARGADSRGLDAQGWLYVPRSCADRARCRLHVVLHGCKQGASFVGERFVRSAGYLEWAASNHIVLLFPQIAPSIQPLNPNGCWDWWGYEGSDYATRDGAQIDAIWRMVIDLGSTAEG